MPVIRPLTLGALAGLALAILSLAALLSRHDPPVAYLIPAAFLTAAVALALLARRPARRAEAVRLDLDRLRPGRLRDASVHVSGYYRQLEALAETLPSPALRAALARDLPTAEATLRAVYDLCLRLQTYELGESQPAALRGASSEEVAALTGAIEAELRATLEALSRIYGELRRVWSAPAVETEAIPPPLAGLAPHADRLRELAATFAPEAARPVAHSES